MTELCLPTPTRLVPVDGPVPVLTAPRLHQLLEQSGLTGRGGGGFATHRKLAALLQHPEGHVVVVGNGMEGEPLSHKDAHLLATAPGLVLDGLAVVAGALGARRTVLALPAGRRTPVLDALGAARRAPVEVVRLPERFVAGQESALVNAVNGGPAVPGPRHVPVRERGVDRRPTLVLNVETLARIAVVVRHGADTGSVLLTLSSSRDTDRLRVLEVDRATSLRQVVGDPAPEAVLVGGFHGEWVRDLDAPLSSLRLGAGVLHALDPRDCPLRVTAGIVGYLADQSAGQCGPCVNGLPAMAAVLRGVVDGSGEVARLEQLCGLVERRGACAHPDGTARLVRSTLTTFEPHVREHLAGRCGR